jgi:hypothetical protein
MEENVTKHHRTKLEKYEGEITNEAKKNGFKFYALIVEFGARGWVPSSAVSALKKIALPSIRLLCNRASFMSLKSSYVIWINRFNKTFNPWRLSDSSLISWVTLTSLFAASLFSY